MKEVPDAKFFKIGQKLTEIWSFEYFFLKILQPILNSELGIKLPKSFSGKNPLNMC